MEVIASYLVTGVEDSSEGIETSAEIAYRTPYWRDGVPVDLVIGLSDQMSANTIFGIPFMTKAKFVIDLEKQQVMTPVFGGIREIDICAPIRQERISWQGGITPKSYQVISKPERTLARYYDTNESMLEQEDE